MKAGPCLPHCYTCPTHVTLLAYVAFAYTLSCVGYLILTRSYGTPLKDSYTEEQLRLKRESATRRGNAFLASLVASSCMLFVWKPFRKG